jgi:hypothetical protein
MYSKSTVTNRSAAQPNVVKEKSADRYPVVQLTSPKSGTLEVSRRVQIKLDLVSKSKNVMLWTEIQSQSQLKLNS